MKIALTQMNTVWENEEENLKKCSAFAREAKEKGADMVIFPEMTLTGFSMNIQKTAKADMNDENIQKMVALSREYDIAVVFGFVLKCGKKAKNCMAVAKNGKTVFYYEKIHPFSYAGEGEYFIGGDKISSCNIGGVNIGGFICYDLRFPLPFLKSSEKNDIIIIIANWPKARVKQWRALLAARAIENQCYIAGVNRVGEGNGLEYVSSSAMFDPTGEMICFGKEGEKLIIAEIDPERVRSCRENFPIRRDMVEGLDF